ncbi:hypothetical protein [Streptomyces seoulensis]|uniref:hypothetical protein n=1 Tax=Streptomyces seoulensis TaxID=73044 RepID=UPI001FCB3B1F|nr:hypothetical protein [Streptomyces seoulensis]BDH04887.1 hypothetical protein HEK131_21140 [Streptomyces seoulensis]
MRVRIAAQHLGDGRMRCELIVTGPHDAEVHVPAVITCPTDDGVPSFLASGAAFEIEVDAPLLQSVSINAGHIVGVQGAER